jgi:hypothetical protein
MKMPQTLLDYGKVGGGTAAALGGTGLLLGGADADSAPNGHPIAGALLGAGAGALLGSSSKAIKGNATKKALAGPELGPRHQNLAAIEKQQAAARELYTGLKSERRAKLNDLVTTMADTSKATRDIAIARDKIAPTLATDLSAQEAARMAAINAVQQKSGGGAQSEALLARRRLKKAQAFDKAARENMPESMREEARLLAMKEAELARRSAAQDAAAHSKDKTRGAAVAARKLANAARAKDPMFKKDLAAAVELEQMKAAGMLAGGGALLGGVGGSFYDNPF